MTSSQWRRWVGAACGKGHRVITPPLGVRVLIATRLVEFRKGMEELA